MISSIVKDPNEAYQLMKDDASLAVDIETTGLHRHRDRIAVISMKGKPSGTTAVIHTRGDNIPSSIVELLRKVPKWLTHNGTNYDLPMMKNKGLHFPDVHYDTLVGEGVLETQGRHDIARNLGATMKRRLGKNFKDDADHTQWMNESLTDEQYMYCYNDVAYLHDIEEVQRDLCHERSLSQALDMEQRLSRVVAQVVYNGLPFDFNKLGSLLDKYEADAEEARVQLAEKWGPKFNVKSPKQVMTALNSIGLFPDTTAEADLLELKEMSPYIDYILLARKERQMKGMFRESWIDQFVYGGRVYGNFWQLGANTTRFTSSDPNFQQIPRSMREVIGGEPGFVVVSADYNQIEVWVAAFISGEHRLIEALLSEDFHSLMARSALSLSVDAEITKEQRTQGKAGTFTLTFCGGIRGIKNMGRKMGIKISDPVAYKVQTGFFKRFPTLKEFHRDLYKRANRGGVVTLLLPQGHQRKLIPPVRPTTMMNTLVQGRAGIGYKLGVLECAKAGLADYIGLFLHDETVATGIPEKEGENFKQEMRECMVRGMQQVCDLPIDVSTTLGPAWIKD